MSEFRERFSKREEERYHLGAPPKDFVHETIELPEVWVTRESEEGRFYTTEGMDGDVPSVTTILEDVVGKSKTLENWKKRVGEEVAEMERSRGAARGNDLHDSLEKYISNRYVCDNTPLTKLKITKIKEYLDNNVEVVYGSELSLISEYLRVAGRFDLFARVKTHGNCVIDYKTSKKRCSKGKMFKYVVQGVIYGLMLEEQGYRPDNIVVLVAIYNDFEYYQEATVPYDMLRDRVEETLLAYKRIQEEAAE